MLFPQKNKLCDKNICTGCKSCSNICPKKCITFSMDDEGFEYPVINKDICVECGLCTRACPILYPKTNLNKRNPSCFFAYSKDDNIVKKSSSGGLFYELSRFVIEQHGVVVGAEMELNTLRVQQVLVEKKEDLIKLCGSKYIQSDTNTIYKQCKQYLETGRLVFFTGTPCMIGGLYSFLSKDYDNLYTAELICHGVPSFNFFNTYLRKTGYKNVSNFYFRDYKIWDYDTKIIANDKSKYLLGTNNFFMKAYLNCEIFREGCYNCQFAKLPRIADLTLGDFWGIKNYVSKSLINKYGNSVILINNEKGRKLFDLVNERCFYQEIDLNNVIKRNYNISRPSIRPQARNTIYKDIEALSLEEISKKYGHGLTLRNILGFIKRRVKSLIV